MLTIYNRYHLFAKKSIYVCLGLLFFGYSFNCFGQETNSQASGRVFSDSNENLAGITISIIHEPTQNKYVSATGDDGYFHFFNLKPGGPYTIVISSAGVETLTKKNLFLHLGAENFSFNNSEITEFHLQKKSIVLDEVILKAVNKKTTVGIETNISNTALQSMPSISRSFQDFVRLVPQAKVTGDGVISLAGQNNRFNSFFIDGANNNDIVGASVSGMNGGQTGSPPISIEAIEEINVLLAPYDAEYGNFTGGSINAITRSGSNDNKSSAWHYFRNENMAGRSPVPLEKPGMPGEFYRPRLSHFFNQTFGIWNSGAFIKNKLFYFALIERQSESRPQPYDMSGYRGNSDQQQLQALYDFIKNKYQYDAGSFLETKDELKATRINVKLDWNLSLNNKFMLSYRLNKAQRHFQPHPASNTGVVFANSEVIIPSTTHSISFEWKHFLKNNKNNRLLFTFTRQADGRQWIGQPFPTVLIADGNGLIRLGSESSTGLFNVNAKDFTLFNVFTWVKKKHVLSAGTDVNYTIHDMIDIGSYFGRYQFQDVNNFMNGSPYELTKGFSFVNDPEKAAGFQLLRNSVFINDNITVSSNLTLHTGLRLDMNTILSRPQEDHFFNDSAASIISGYYNLYGAASGKVMKSQLSFSPRISADYKIKSLGLNLKAGAGIFSGHILNAWTNDEFSSSLTGTIFINPQQYGLSFNADPYNQPTPQSLNRDPASFKGDLNLRARHFKYPSVFRLSLTGEKNLKHGWVFSIEGMITKNIHEIVIQNVNILPPGNKSALPGARNIYSIDPAPQKIVLRSSGMENPYTNIYLLSNNGNKKGSAWSLSFIVQKQVRNFSFNGSYTYGSSRLLFEITGTETPISQQWINMETVNGRNYTGLSTSDNDLGHRITAWLSQKIRYGKNKTATSISVFYNGQSGIPYSYVYGNSMINDNGVIGQNFDLIYIPTINDLNTMNFVPITSSGQIVYSSQQQKYLLNNFIESDKYLRNHRGEFSRRNAARLPFTNIIDLRLQQDFKVRLGNKHVGIAVSYDVFNFTNMINKDWGRIYFLNNDSYPLITFAGWADPSSLIPQYQFRPFSGKPYAVQTSTLPGNSARWLSQLGFKINLD